MFQARAHRRAFGRAFRLLGNYQHQSFARLAPCPLSFMPLTPSLINFSEDFFQLFT